MFKRIIRYKRTVRSVLAVLACMFLFWLFCMHFTPVGRMSIMRNHFTGEISHDTPGFHITPPWVQAAQIDLRPMTLCITSAGRGYNCRLVQFVPEHYEEFVEVEGFRYYWLANRISFNCGHDRTYRGFEDIMRGHAFGAESYNFIREIRSYENP